MDTEIASPSQTPRKAASNAAAKCDHKDNLPDPYITFNPAMLDDEKWTFRDLQKLASKLGVGAKGTRDQLIYRLREWHKRQFNSFRRCAGSNFSLLEVELPPSPPKDENGNPVSKGAGLNPALLSPLKTRPTRNADGTPKSILRSATMKKRTESHVESESPISSAKKSITFSIFNGTKIIPPREEIRRMWAYEDGIDIDASSEEEVEEDQEYFEQDDFGGNNLASAFQDAVIAEAEAVVQTNARSTVDVTKQFDDQFEEMLKQSQAQPIAKAQSHSGEDLEVIARIEREWLNESASSSIPVASTPSLPRVSNATANQVLKSLKSPSAQSSSSAAPTYTSPFIPIQQQLQQQQQQQQPKMQANISSASESASVTGYENIEPVSSKSAFLTKDSISATTSVPQKQYQTRMSTRSSVAASVAIVAAATAAATASSRPYYENSLEEVESGVRQLSI